MANEMSAIPGPSSRATIEIPRFSPEWIMRSTTSPRLACSTMLRATSEMAVATRVRSLPENPAFSANARPCCRAIMMSASEPTGTLTSVSASPGTAPSLAGSAFQQHQTFFEIERGRDISQIQAQLDHRESNFRLDAGDDGLCSAQSNHLGQGTKRADRKRVQHVERGYIYDDAA